MEQFPEGSALAASFGSRTVLSVPLLQDGIPKGTVNLRREVVKPFGERQIALLETLADQAVIAIENVRLFKELEARNRELTTALDTQTATSDILRVISMSQTAVQPVFEAIVGNSVRLCEGLLSVVYRFDGELMHMVAHHNISAEGLEIAQGMFPMRPHRGLGAGRAIMERGIVHIPDTELDPDFRSLALSRAVGWRSGLFVPMMRDGAPIGVIGVARSGVGPFSDNEIELLKTFADQAVIAIENVRLFTELQEKNDALTQAHAQVTESLEQQTATSDVLRIIAQSPTELQPVLEVIATSALRLCAASDVVIERLEGDRFYNAAHAGTQMKGLVGQPLPLTRRFPGGRAVLDRRPVIVDDIMLIAESEYPDTLELLKLNAVHSVVEIPLLSEGKPLGSLAVLRAEVRPFTDTEVALLKTFADQAVIAIENVRLFTELQEKNRALTQAHAQVSEALEQQTATSEILSVISSSPTELQPVFDVIAKNAFRLCGGAFAILYRYDGALMSVVADVQLSSEGSRVLRALHPAPPRTDHVVGLSIIENRIVHTRDVSVDPEFPGNRNPFMLTTPYKSSLVVPMRREGTVIGAIGVARGHVQPYSEAEIELLKTFADQAVIAIENVRLFTELQEKTAELTRSVDELTALGEVGRALSSTLNLEAVLLTIVTRATQLTETAGCVIWEYDKPCEEFRQRVSHYADDADAAILPVRGGVTTIPRGQGLTTQVMEERQAVQIPDITVEGAYESPVRMSLIAAGHRALLGVPLLSEDEIIGVLAVTRKTPGLFEPETVRLLSTFATQSALAIQNARLFHEIEDKSRQLEAASRHKSEFLANMSHELRTPLNAIIGFSEVLAERMFGELNEKQDEYLKDIYASGQHLLSLINDILDLSKVEAGRMELELADFSLPAALDNALTLVRERANRRGITLGRAIDDRVGMIRGDERKVKQVLLNLLSNALKFTPEGGRIDVRATMTDGMAEISVADTGVGIAPEDQEAIFEEFRQVGTADKKVEGTGLGLALSRKFIELHGGRIWVHSQPGKGSAFSFTLPAS
jgi:GAF domain-containing protein